MKIPGFKSYLPHIIAIVLFILLSYIYFFPVLEGKILKANDSLVAKYNSKEIQDYREKSGTEPLWTNSLFSGMPAYLISVKYPGNLLKHVDNLLRIFKIPVSILFLSLLGFYIVLLMFKVEPWLALAGSLAYGFSSFFFLILAAGHNTQAVALAYMAPMIGGIYFAYRYNAIKGAIFTGFILALQLIANHPQITYYGFICLLIFGITELIYTIREKKFMQFLKTSAILIVPFVLAIGVNFGNLNNVREYGEFSMRGKSDLVVSHSDASSGLDRSYITNWSYGIGETMDIFIPNFRGGSSHPFDRDSETVKALRQNGATDYINQFYKYWGDQPSTEGPHYIGAILVFLFVLGLILVKGREKWWLLSATILSVALAWGKYFMPLTNLFIDYFPGYNKFRSVTMILVIAQFCIPLLGLIALRDIFNGSVTRKDIVKGLKWATGITGGIALLFLVAPGLAGSFLSEMDMARELPAWLKTALINDRQEMLKSDSLRTLVFILLSASALLAFIYEKIRREYAILALGFLILLDLWTVDKRYLNSEKFESPSAIQKSISPTVADQIILKDPSYNRVLNLTTSVFNDNSPTSYFHKSIGGYHGAKMRRYQELIDSVISGELNMVVNAFNNAKSSDEVQSAFTETNALNMLNTKYIIYNPEGQPLINTRAFGNAWFVEKPVFAENANEELGLINRIDPLKEAVIDKIFSNQVSLTQFSTDESDRIELTSYQPNELVYKYSASAGKLVVFSEIYYPKGWKALVDGKESDHFRANYVLRAMVVPAGNHEIKFVFEPDSYYFGNKVSLASSVILILLLAGYFAFSFWKKQTS